MTQPNGEPQSTPTPTPTPPQGGGNGTGDGNGQQQQQQNELDSPKFTQRDYNRFEARIKDEYRQKRQADEELIELGKQAKEALDAQRPLEERVTSLSTESAQKDSTIASLQTDNLRMKLAGAARLHPDLWDRVRGNTEDEINADIETLKKFAPADEQPPAGAGNGSAPRGGPAPNHQQGQPPGNPNATGSIAAGRDLHKQRHGTNSDASV